MVDVKKKYVKPVGLMNSQTIQAFFRNNLILIKCEFLNVLNKILLPEYKNVHEIKEKNIK